MAEKLSLVVTTLNNAATLPGCLHSARWADDILVLDSFSTDDTCAVAARFGARVVQHEFQGYAKQKQMAIDLAEYDWVLLLDADEALGLPAAAEIRSLLARGPTAQAYSLPRIEQLFWRWTSTRVRLNHFLRLFDRRHTAMNDIPIHAAPECTGAVARLSEGFYHFGEPDIRTKVDKLNYYSSGLVEHKAARGRVPSPWRLVLYLPFAFVKSYVFKRNFLNGWAGFIGSVCMAFYAFLKYAKLYEHFQPDQLERKGVRLDTRSPDPASQHQASSGAAAKGTESPEGTSQRGPAKVAKPGDSRVA
jgi:glycosyltransferase involved in cell wall biosynthesis